MAEWAKDVMPVARRCACASAGVTLSEGQQNEHGTSSAAPGCQLVSGADREQLHRQPPLRAAKVPIRVLL